MSILDFRFWIFDFRKLLLSCAFTNRSKIPNQSKIQNLKSKIAGVAFALSFLWAERLLADECWLVTDFSKNLVGEFPTDWKPKEEQARAIYRVMEENGARFVRATAEGSGLQMGKEFRWDLTTHPVLTWRWRPQVFPSGSDERESARNDSALGVYAVFPHTWVSVKTVKYLWSLVAPVGGTAQASMGLTRMLVLRSGPPKEDGWREEAVNVVQDYQRLFGEAPKRALGIALLTDADETRSRAVGEYAAFRVCPQAQ